MIIFKNTIYFYNKVISLSVSLMLFSQSAALANDINEIVKWGKLHKEAESWIKKAETAEQEGNIELQFRYLDKAVSIEPIYSLERRALFHKWNGNRDAAIADYTRSIELKPTHCTYNGQSELVQDYWQRANLFDEQEDDFKRALADYGTVIETGSPTWKETALLDRAKLFERMGLEAKATEDLDAAISLNPIKGLLGKAEFLARIGKQEAADKCFNTAYENAELDETALYELVKSVKIVGPKELVLKVLERSRRNETSPASQIWRLLDKANILLKAAQYPEALHVCEQAEPEIPKDQRAQMGPYLLLVKAQCLIRTGNVVDARTMLANFIETTSSVKPKGQNERWLLFQRIQATKLLGNYSNALEALNTYRNACPAWLSAGFYLEEADILTLLGRNEDAIAVYKKLSGSKAFQDLDFLDRTKVRNAIR